MKYLIPLVLIATGLLAQENKVDPAAVQILDKMSAVIGEMQSCSYSITTSVDAEQYPYGMVKKIGSSDVYMTGPDKMMIHAYQNDHHKGYWYDGDSLAYYSFDENNYVKIQAPNTILATIDSLKETYEIDFPAADFFYPAFTDDVLENFETLYYLGEDNVAGKSCFHLKAENKEMAVQIWIADDAFNLPQKFVIQYKTKEGMPQYEAHFENWQVNPELPESIYEFTPPAGARLIAIMASSKK